jgi:hypothetical protein
MVGAEACGFYMRMRGGIILPMFFSPFKKCRVKWLSHGATHDYSPEPPHVINAAAEVKRKSMAEFSFQV